MKTRLTMKASKRFIFAALLVLLPGACVFIQEQEKDTLPAEKEELNPPEIKRDSVSLWLKIKPVCPFEYKIGRVDYFLYQERLIGHFTSTREEPLEIKVEKGLEVQKLYALTNGFGEYNEQALWHHDIFKDLIMDIRDERKGYPFMSGVLDISGDYKDTVEVEIRALSSEIRIRSVSNLSTDYSLLENPRIYVRNAYPRARPFSPTNYSSSGEYYDTEREFLSQDIGIYSLYPDMKLYTYPNDIPETELSPGTELVMEYEKEGRTYEKSWSLYPLERNSLEILDLDIR